MATSTVRGVASAVELGTDDRLRQTSYTNVLDTVSIPILAKSAQIAPTAVSCQDFLSGAPDLNSLGYGVKSGKINSISPGVLFYYSKVTAPGASFTITVPQTNTLGWKIMGIQPGQALLYDASCNKLNITGSQAGNGTVTYNVTGATAGALLIVGIKYDPGTLVGQAVSKSGTPPVFPTNTYNFSTAINGSTIATSLDSIQVVPR